MPNRPPSTYNSGWLSHRMLVLCDITDAWLRQKAKKAWRKKPGHYVPHSGCSGLLQQGCVLTCLAKSKSPNYHYTKKNCHRNEQLYLSNRMVAMTTVNTQAWQLCLPPTSHPLNLSLWRLDWLVLLLTWLVLILTQTPIKNVPNVAEQEDSQGVSLLKSCTLEI